MVENSVQFVNVGRGLFLGRVVFFQEYQGEWLALLAQGGGRTFVYKSTSISLGQWCWFRAFGGGGAGGVDL